VRLTDVLDGAKVTYAIVHLNYHNISFLAQLIYAKILFSVASLINLLSFLALHERIL
jgi:hypothetical protein